jgi:hypothetical protein
MLSPNDLALPTPPSDLLSTKEAADFLRLSMPTLERFRIMGGGPEFIKLGPGKRARVYYRLSALESWLKAQTRHNTSQHGGVT